MTARVRKLLEQALELSPEERGEFVRNLDDALSELEARARGAAQ